MHGKKRDHFTYKIHNTFNNPFVLPSFVSAFSTRVFLLVQPHAAALLVLYSRAAGARVSSLYLFWRRRPTLGVAPRLHDALEVLPIGPPHVRAVKRIARGQRREGLAHGDNLGVRRRRAWKPGGRQDDGVHHHAVSEVHVVYDPQLELPEHGNVNDNGVAGARELASKQGVAEIKALVQRREMSAHRIGANARNIFVDAEDAAHPLTLLN